MKKWIATTDDLHFCQITFDGDWYRTKVENEFGDTILENESISIEGAKKQIKRCVGTGIKIKWSETDTEKIDLSGRLHLPTGYLSVSQVRKYLKCPLQYEFKYIAKMKETLGSSLVMGRAFHKGMQMASLKKVMEGEILSTDDVLDVYSESFDYERENRDIDWAEDDPDRIKDDGSKLVTKFYEELGMNQIPLIGPDGMPYIEKNHTFEIVPGLKVNGIIDIIESDGSIRDYKTSAKSPSKNVLDDGIQLPVYAMMYRDLTGEKEKAVGLDYAVNLKKEKKIMRVETEGPILDGDIERAKHTFVGVAKSISAGIFYPNEESNACGYCSFRRECKKKPKL